MNVSGYFLCITLIMITTSCGVNKPWYRKSEKQWNQNSLPDNVKLLHSVYLIGDAGNPGKDGLEPALKLLQHKIQATPEMLPVKDRTVIFLGDNVYDYGLPPESHIGREEAEQRLISQLNIVKDHPGKKIMIPGNHDWNIMLPGGWKYVIRQQQFVEQYLHDSTTYYPKGGCPGPVEIDVGHDITLIVIDSEWWLYRYEKPYGVGNPCDVNDEFDLMVQFQNTIRKNKRKHILIVMHHPLYSNGNHGGYFSLKDYIFPLTLLKEKWYIPLPVIGSIYPFARKYGFSREDIPNPVYQKFKTSLMSILKGYDKVVVASGHDHNLQLIRTGDIHHVISGSAVKLNHVIRGGNALFVAKEHGLSIINYYDNGQAWVEFWKPDENNPDGNLIFKKPLYAMQPEEAPPTTEIKIPDYSDSTIIKPIATEYRASALKKILFGTTYRKEWETPVKFKYLDIKTVAGGLTPIKRGGGMQTVSLRLKGRDGNQYTLRMIDKNPVAVLPEALRETFVGDLVKDQASSTHPYGALSVPKLAEAIDVYHTNPKYYYVPFTPELGQFVDEFGGKIAMLEIRPDEDLSEFRNFGRSKNVVGSEKMLEEISEDNDTKVDTKDYLRARYLDLIINDWDRHADQWRWAEFKEDNKTIYRPVPRDRDQAFAMYNGIMPRIIASRFFSREISPFTCEIQDMKGQTLQALHLDRRLLSNLDKNDWLKEAEHVQKNLTDSVIESAIKDMPEEIYGISGEEIIAKLKQRRNDLIKYAEAFYEILAGKVDIVLSEKHEYVLIERKENGRTQVRAWKRDLDAGKDQKIEQRLYARTFNPEETKEIRIYCLSGRDSVLITGEADKSTLVRIIGGEDEDYIEDRSSVSSLFNKTRIYDYNDRIERNTIIPDKEGRVQTSHKAWVNEYEFENFQYDKVQPLLILEYDVDYGVFLGGGVNLLKYGFRTIPYSSMHKIRANHSLSTNSFNFDFEGTYPTVFGQRSGLNARIELDGPDFVINYFGQGNESEYTGAIQQYRVGLNYYSAELRFTHSISNQIKLNIGPVGEYVSVETRGSNIESPLSEQEEFIFTGGGANVTFDFTNRRNIPTRGLRWANELSCRSGKGSERNYSFAKYRSEVTLYVTPNTPLKLTFALRTGGELTIGDFPFYHSAFIGGRTNLRGYRAFRFAGRNSLYQNLEARLTFSRIRGSVLTGTWGPYGFLDHGRVWADNEQSRIWHAGYGGGLWMRFYDLVTLSGGVGFSPEGPYFRINSGFFF